jgi:hypothetical protein
LENATKYTEKVEQKLPFGPAAQRTMAEYHMTKIKRRVVKAQVVYFTNGCPM